MLPAAGPLRPSDLRPLLTLAVHLRTLGSMPQRLTARGLGRRLRDVGIEVRQARRHRFTFPLRTPEDARLALRSLYTPSQAPERLAAAERALARLAGPDRHLPLPLLRVVARRSHQGPPAAESA